MGKIIDERVVEMRFDNKQFESATKETMGTLARLKNALDFSKSGKVLNDLDKTVQNFSFDGMSAGIATLEKRFSTLGIVGMRVIENLTDAVMNKLATAWNVVSDSIISGGVKRAMNLEKAHFQLQNIIGDEARVQEVMDAANASVDGTAYSFDVAAKAASQFYASGITDMGSMDQALRGLAGTTATFSADYEQMAMIWTQVAGQGRVMGDQLLQLSTRGANAAVEISKFMNGVNDGSIQASESVKAAVREVSKSTNNTEADIRDFVSKGKINFDIFAEAMNHAFGDSAQKANETFDGALANIKSALARIGAGFISPLIAQNNEIVKLFNVVRVKVNDVKKALVFDEEIGNVHALSKQFTDSILGMAKVSAKWIENLDLSKPMSIFYYGIESIKNVAKGLGSVLSPVGKAFREVFLSFSIDSVVDLAASVEKLTRNFRLTDKASKGLHDALEGIFSIVKLLVDAFLGLFGVTVQVGRPINSLAEWLLVAAGAAGRALTAFSKWIRECPMLNRVLNSVADSIRFAMTWLGDFIRNIDVFVTMIKNLPVSQRIVEALGNAFEALGDFAGPHIEILIKKTKQFKDSLKEMIPQKVDSAIRSLKNSFEEFARFIDGLNFSKPNEILDVLRDKVDGITRFFADNKGVSRFVENIKEFIKALKEAFSLGTISEKLKGIGKAFENFKEYFNFDNVISNLEKAQIYLGKFVTWVKDNVGPMFEGFSVGGAVAGAGGIGLIYAFVKIASAFEKISGTLKTIPDMLGDIKGTLKAYQTDLKASALIKVAGAIAILAGALTVMSFADTGRLIVSATALSIVAKLFLDSASSFLEAAKKTKTATDALYKVGEGINNLAKAVKWKAIGGAIKDLAASVAIITGSIIAIAVMYKKDSASMDSAVKLIAVMTGTLVTIMGVMTIIGEKMGSGMKAFGKAASGLFSLAMALGVAVAALSILFKMEFPSDWKEKLGVLGGIFAMLAVMAVAVGKGSSFGGGKLSSGGILALTVMLVAAVKSLKMLFDMELPDDWKIKFSILTGIFGLVAVLSIAIGKAGKEAGGALKASGTILSLCVFVATSVAALMILSLIPGDKLLKGAVALGAVLLALGGALIGAGKVADKSAAQAVLMMAVTVGAITASLGLLSLVSWTKLLKGVVSLGAVLLLMGSSLNSASKVSSPSSWKSIIAMAAAVMTISGSLVALSNQPWSGLLSAAASLSATLLAFSYSLKMISKSSGIKPEKIGLFLAATASLIPIGIALYELAKQPWQSLLAASTALTATILAFAETMRIISASRGIRLEKITTFLLATLAVVPIGVALYALAGQPWQQLTAAALALSGTILAFTAAFAIISNTSINPVGIASFLTGTAGVALIAYSIYQLAEQPWNSLLAAAASISAVLLAMSAAMAICTLVGSAAGPAIAGIALLDLFVANFVLVLLALGKIFEDPTIAKLLSGGMGVLAQLGYAIGDFVGSIVGGALAGMTSGLPAVGENLSAFMSAAQPFFSGVGSIDNSVTNGIKNLAISILAMTGADILNGLTSWLTGGSSFVHFGEELEAFAPHFAAFASAVSGIDGAVVQNASNAALAMAEMANKLPNSGGLAAKILGDNSLSDFGEELSKFGPNLASFASSVTTVNSDAVTAAANSAQIMSEMASNLPNSGGLAAKILGDNTLSSFGEELVRFGPLIAQYATSVAGIDGNAVTASANAAKSLSELANNLPNSGGLVSWFTGDNTMDQFGNQLVKLGEGMASYYNKIMSVDFGSFIQSSSALTSLIGAVKVAQGVSAESVVQIVNNLNQAAISGITQFTTAFQNAGPQVTSTITSFIQKAISAISQRNPMFKTEGTKSANAYLNAIKSLYGLATQTGQQLATKVLGALQQKVSEFKTKGTSSGSSYVQGISAQNGAASNAGSSLANSAANGLGNVASVFRSVGENCGASFCSGVRAYEGEAAAAGAAIGRAAYRAAKAEMQINSPSKKMMDLGENSGMGYVIGLDNTKEIVSKTAREMANGSFQAMADAVSNISSLVESNMNFDPTITPSINLDNVVDGMDKINQMFNNAVQATAVNMEGLNFQMSRARNGQASTANGNEYQSENGYNKIEFNQYNTSPKALSRIDIYRDTQNQITRFEQMVGLMK